MTIVALHYITTNHWKVAQYVIQNVAHLIAFCWDSRTPRILGVASEYCEDLKFHGQGIYILCPPNLSLPVWIWLAHESIVLPRFKILI